MHVVRLRITVNSGMCARLWHQFFSAEVTSNRILHWISILQRKGQGGSKRFTEINILFVRYCVFYLPDQAKSEWLCGMNDHHSFFRPVTLMHASKLLSVISIECALEM